MKVLMILAIFAAVTGMFQFGFNTGVINSPQIYIEKFINESYIRRNGTAFSDNTISILFSVAVCSCLVAGMIGGLGAGYVADKFGRRNGLWLVQWFSVAGSILMGTCKVADSYEMLVIGRFLIGLACGFFTGLVPLYITEVAPVNIRGGLGTLNQLAVTTGILSSQILGLDVVLGSEENWPLLLALGGLIPSAIQLALLPFMPKSPKYLIINKEKLAEGLSALEKLRRQDVTEEYDEICHMRNEVTDDSIGILDLLKSKIYLLPVFICICMHLSQQLSGIVAIFYYSTKFFTNAGVSDETAKYATLGVGAIMVSMTLITIPLMDQLGRRTLHLGGLAGILIFSILITIFSTQSDKGDWVAYAIIGANYGFVMSFALGPGSIPWLITGELFDQGPRPAAIAIATVVNWTANLIVGLLFPPMEQSLKEYTFLPFTVMVAIFFVILWVYLPETKGKSTTEITSLFARPNAWKGRCDSTSY